MKNRILKVQTQNFKSAKKSCISSYIDAESKRLDSIIEDIELTGDVITKDNISLYYKFMNDLDLVAVRDVIDEVYTERRLYIIQILNWANPILKDTKKSHFLTEAGLLDYLKHYKAIKIRDYFLKQSFFRVEDSLKPLEEYINEIKTSEQYKEYASKKETK